jgi:alanyl-tRNA synthetase
MTIKLYDIDSHLSEFSATVLSCENAVAVLDKTAFFPEGGGQTSDTGYIDGVRVNDVQIKDGVIYHYLEKDIEIGKAVNCVLDWEERFRKMQNHSGEHIISGIVHSLYGYDNVGFHLSKTEMTMDFSGMLTRTDLEKIELLANKAVWENVKFNCYYPENLENLEYRSKLDLTEDVRIVEIENYDRCACCAPHVNTSAEIGIIKILDFEKNKGGVRLWVKCGADALADYNLKYQSGLKISSLLCTEQGNIATAVERLVKNEGDLKFKITDLKRRLIAEKVKAFSDDSSITAEFESDMDIKELQLYADALYKKAGGIRAVFSGKENEYFFAIVGDEAPLQELFKQMKNNLNIRGGGRGSMVQGTVFAERSEILKIML